MLFEIIVSNWGAWAPGLTSRDDWRQWRRCLGQGESDTAPASAAVPKPLQRRQSPLARAALHAIGQCIAADESLPTVFSSAHGEIGSSLNMLESLQAGEELSPTAFSLSVYNSIAGLFSMAYGNRNELTVIAPGADGMGAGFVEALGILQEGHAEVLLVFYDERMPAFFPVAPFILSQSFPCALALKLTASGEGLALRFDKSAAARQEGEQPLQLPLFIEFLVSDQPMLQLGDHVRGWRWRKI
ncbi:MAG: beta-ketoacyl synthase chain length factor [Methylomonas sp.]|jgi:hypothetical protein